MDYVLIYNIKVFIYVNKIKNNQYYLKISF